MAHTIERTFAEPDIAVLTFDQPDRGANVLSSSVLDELEQHLDELATRDDLRGLILRSGKPGIFVAGADLREFVASIDVPDEEAEAMCRRGQTLFARLSQGPAVSVAAIDGVCLGGGAELAIWCDRRILSNNPRTQFGFPEVKLGLYPGWGGTARTPRMIGLANAVEMVTGGAPIAPERARVLGLASDVVAPDEMMDAAIRLIREECETRAFECDRAGWSGPLRISETELGFLGVTASAVIRQETKGKYPAPEAALEVMLEAATQDIDAACRLEARGMARLFGSPVNRALLNVFFLTDRNKKDPGIADRDVAPKAVRQVGVIGAGIMGSGIAAANVKRGFVVTMGDANQDALDKGLRRALEEASYDREKKGPAPEKLAENAPRLNEAASEAAWAGCDLLIEAIIEKKDAKRELYERLEKVLPAEAVLASNTSTIPITELAAGLARPEQFCGIHFFNPVRRMQLIEVIRGERTSDTTVATAVAYAKRLGKMPVVVEDGPGFLVNRLLVTYMNESLELLAEGVSLRTIERAATRFGMPMGPLTLYDVVGLDTAVYAGRQLWEAFPDRINPSPILPRLLKAGRLGQKSGAGFFSYANKKGKAQPDPELDRILGDLKGEGAEPPLEVVTMRLVLPMLLEATRMISEGKIRDVRDIDLALIFGIGFPPFRGGLLFWADAGGLPTILKQLESFTQYGTRYEPTSLLRKLAEKGETFYASAGS